MIEEVIVVVCSQGSNSNSDITDEAMIEEDEEDISRGSSNTGSISKPSEVNINGP